MGIALSKTDKVRKGPKEKLQMEDKKVTIIIAAHKKYRMPKDSMYLPVHVGAEGRELIGYQPDNVGDNISVKNPGYCELTGLYWAWKNVTADYIGLAHYRRHFSMKPHGEGWERVLRYEELNPYLGKVKVFTPNKRRYYIETLYSHYAHTHFAEQLDETEKIINQKYPEYAASYGKVVRQTYGYMFNMMIMEKSWLDNYCSWLFDILFELERRIGTMELSTFQGRYFGRISEIIFNVWLDYQTGCGNLKKNEVMEIPCVHMEKTDWRKKGTAFFKAKFLRIKYEESF